MDSLQIQPLYGIISPCKQNIYEYPRRFFYSPYKALPLICFTSGSHTNNGTGIMDCTKRQFVVFVLFVCIKQSTGT